MAILYFFPVYDWTGPGIKFYNIQTFNPRVRQNQAAISYFLISFIKKWHFRKRDKSY